MSEIVTVCKVHGELTLDKAIKYGFQYKTRKRRYACAVCAYARVDTEKRRKYQRDYMKRKYDADPQAAVERVKKSKMKFIDKVREYNRKSKEKWRKANPELSRERVKQSYRKSIDTLSDSYVKQVLVEDTGLHRSELPQSLIELKRVQIQLRRKIASIKACKQS